MTSLEENCRKHGLRMTGQRLTIIRALAGAGDHPDVEQLHRHCAKTDPRISLATVYRTIRLMEEAGIISRLDIGDGRARYEDTCGEHHHHLIDVETGKITEFRNDRLERLKQEIAESLGYELVGHRLELYGVKKGKSAARLEKPRKS